jgi:hypothetical protein
METLSAARVELWGRTFVSELSHIKRFGVCQDCERGAVRNAELAINVVQVDLRRPFLVGVVSTIGHFEVSYYRGCPRPFSAGRQPH